MACLVAAPAEAATRTPTEKALAGLYRAGEITAGEYRERVTLYRDAAAAAKRLRGNLAGVVADTDAMARRGFLVKARLHPVFTILEQNHEYFAVERGAPARYGARRTFEGSPVQWQFYSGHGWQIQPLANWGTVNGLLDKRQNQRALRHAQALLELSVALDGYRAFEYYFPFSGGPAGWSSAMPQASAMYALARLWQRTGDQHWLDRSHELMALLEIGPPAGVRLATPSGAHYLLYSQNSDLLVGNGFASVLVSLYDYVGVTGDGRARALLDAGLAEAAASFPAYDTGAWSLYHRTAMGDGREADLHYHQLFSFLLRRLCKRLGTDPYCALGTRLKEYESQPVGLTGLGGRVSKGILRVGFEATKIGRATVRVLDGERTIRSTSLAIKRGRTVVRFKAPPEGDYRLQVDAVSLTGVKSAATTPPP